MAKQAVVIVRRLGFFAPRFLLSAWTFANTTVHYPKSCVSLAYVHTSD